MAMCGLSLVAAGGGLSLLQYTGFSLPWLQPAGASLCGSTQASHCRGFSCCKACALERAGFSSRGVQAYLLHSIWDLPRQGSNQVPCFKNP